MIKWLKKRKEAKQRQQYMDGFGWAMTAHYVEGITEKGIRRKLEIGEHFEGIGEFERGAYYALGIINTQNTLGATS